MQLFLKILIGVANMIDPDQIVSSGFVWSGSALFAYAILSAILVYEILRLLPYPKTKEGQQTFSFSVDSFSEEIHNDTFASPKNRSVQLHENNKKHSYMYRLPCPNTQYSDQPVCSLNQSSCFIASLKSYSPFRRHPANTQRPNNVAATSWRCSDVVTTLFRLNIQTSLYAH